MNRDINNSLDIIDSRDVTARIEELESERESTAIHTTCIHCGQDIEGSEDSDDWRDRGNNSACPNDSGKEHEPPEDTRGELPEDEMQELTALIALQDEAEGYCSDWHYGACLIRDSYFAEYAEQLADEIGAIDAKANWPLNHIDWQAAADELKSDYTEVDFDGVAYWVR